MKQAVQPYFHFDGNCREAMEFYGQLFEGKLEIMSIGESPMKEHFSKEHYDEIMHSRLTNGDFCIMASDMCGMGELTPGNSVDINLNCSSEEEINHLYKPTVRRRKSSSGAAGTILGRFICHGYRSVWRSVDVVI